MMWESLGWWREHLERPGTLTLHCDNCRFWCEEGQDIRHQLRPTPQLMKALDDQIAAGNVAFCFAQTRDSPTSARKLNLQQTVPVSGGSRGGEDQVRSRENLVSPPNIHPRQPAVDASSDVALTPLGKPSAVAERMGFVWWYQEGSPTEERGGEEDSGCTLS